MASPVSPLNFAPNVPRSAPQILRMIEALVALIDAGTDQRFAVAAMPDKPSDFDLSGRDGAVLIQYERSRFETSTVVDHIPQHRVVSFALIVLVRSLNGEGGSYRALSNVLQAVAGQRIVGSTPLELVEELLDEEREGLWRWIIRCTCIVPYVARQTPNPPSYMTAPIISGGTP